jgi:quercetin dioxygenase-like cupin family protein
MIIVKQFRILPALVAATVLIVGFVFAQQAGQQNQAEDLPPGPTQFARSVLEDQSADESFDVVQLVLDFAPGAWTPMHTHGGRGIVTVLEGVMTVRMEDGTETTYQAGEMWAEEPGEYAEVGNAGDAPARVMVTFILPEGAQLTTVQE